MVVSLVLSPAGVETPSREPSLLFDEAKKQQPPDEALSHSLCSHSGVARAKLFGNRRDQVTNLSVEAAGRTLRIQQLGQGNRRVPVQKSDRKLDGQSGGRSGFRGQWDIARSCPPFLGAEPHPELRVGGCHDEDVANGEPPDVRVAGIVRAIPGPCSPPRFVPALRDADEGVTFIVAFFAGRDCPSSEGENS